MRLLKGSQNVFIGNQCLDFLTENHKACLSTHFQTRMFCVATSVDTARLCSMPGSYLGHRTLGAREGQGERAAARRA